MKVKIRGLVFAGFAAAVFAQSAVAEIVPPTEANPSLTDEQVDDLKKTVTSKYYVNENFQERQVDPLTENSNGDVVEKAVHVPWKYGQGSLNKQYVKLQGKMQLAAGSSGLDTEYVEIVHGGKGADAHYVQINEIAVTTEESNLTGADKIAAAGEDTATSLEKGRLTTAKAVYDFVTEELDGMGANMKGNTTYHTQKVAVMKDAWIQAHPLDAPYVENPTGEQLNNIDHWELIVPNSTVTIDEEESTGADKIAAAGVTGASDAVKNKLTTAKAVYDFVTDPNDGFQRKITSQEATSLAGFNNSTDAGEGVMIGHRGTGTNAGSEWYVFGAKANGIDQSNSANNHLSYLEVYKDTAEAKPKFLINIKDGALAETAAAIEAGGNATGETAYLSRDKLTTAKAVFDYVQSITHGQTLPLMPSACEVSGVHCALVSSWKPAESVTNPDTGETTTVPAHTELEWTVMAPGA